MNLAELRKKAQKERPEEGCPVAPPEVFIPVVEEVLTTAAVAPPAAAAEPSPSLVLPEAAPLPVPAAAVAVAEAPEAFDPLALLLAGREAALGDESALAEGTAEAGGEQFQEFLCFRVSSEIYAINIMEIREIIKPREVTEVPRAPAFVSGVLSLRGIIIPIFDMRLRLGLPLVEKTPRERIIVLKKAEEFFGILVDEVIQVVRIPAASIEKPPAVLDDIDRDFVSGIGRFDGQMLILLNQEKILDLTIG